MEEKLKKDKIVVCFSRIPSLIFTIIALPILYVAIDFKFIGNLELVNDIDQNTLYFWPIFFMILFSLAITLKTVIKPSIMLSVDHAGVKVGKGIFKNTLLHVPWKKVKDIIKGEMKVIVKTGNNRHRAELVPALRFTFDSSINLWNRGFKYARPLRPAYDLEIPTENASPEDLHSYVIATNVINEPLDSLIKKINEIKHNRY